MYSEKSALLVFKLKGQILRLRGKSMCLGIDVLQSEEEVFDIGYPS